MLSLKLQKIMLQFQVTIGRGLEPQLVKNKFLQILNVSRNFPPVARDRGNYTDLLSLPM